LSAGPELKAHKEKIESGYEYSVARCTLCLIIGHRQHAAPQYSIHAICYEWQFGAVVAPPTHTLDGNSLFSGGYGEVTP